jgi:hypothetical protein
MCHSLCGVRVAPGVAHTAYRYHRCQIIPPPVVRSRLARNYRHPGFITAIEPITAPRWLPASSHYAQSSVGVALYIKLYRRYAPVYTAHPFSHIHTSSSVKAGSAHETRES